MLSGENMKYPYIINMKGFEFPICIFFVSLGQGLLKDDFCYWQLICRFLQISEDIPLNEMLPFCCCQKWKIREGDTVLGHCIQNRKVPSSTFGPCGSNVAKMID